MSQPGLWTSRDLEHILGDFGVFVLERAGTDIDEALANLKQWEDNIYYIPQVVSNEISSTKVRLLLRRQMSIDYLIPHDVVDYIEENGLYQDEDATLIDKVKASAGLQTPSSSSSSAASARDDL
jgi:nicotinamide mononucleotide adenylyltransferase